MAIRVASSLHRNRYGILYFRMAVPADLQHCFPSKEIYRSLRTASVREAMATAQTFSIALKELFSHLRSATMSDPNKPPRKPPSGLDVGLRMSIQIPGLGTATIETEEKDTPDQIDAAVTAALRQAANLVGVTPTVALNPVIQSDLTSAYIGPYFDDLPAEQMPKEKTLEQYRASIETFIKIVGDKPLHELTREDANQFEPAAVHGSKLKGDIQTAVEDSAKILHRILLECTTSGSLPDTNKLAP